MSRRASNNDSLERSKRALEAAGFEVRRRVHWVKHSFEVDKERLQALRNIAAAHGLKLKDAVDESLGDWIKKKGGGS